MRTESVVLALIGYVIVVFSLAGCGSIMNRKPRAISIYTEPVGAECTVGGRLFTSPARVEIPSDHNYTTSCRKDGYETSYMFIGTRLSGWTWFNGLMPWFFFGTIYDYNHEAAYYFDPGTVHMRLRPLIVPLSEGKAR